MRKRKWEIKWLWRESLGTKWLLTKWRVGRRKTCKVYGFSFLISRNILFLWVTYSQVPKDKGKSNVKLRLKVFRTTCSLAANYNPLLVTPTCTRRSLHGGDGGALRSHSSTVLTKSLVSLFIIEWSPKRSLTNPTLLGKDSSILRVKIARVLSFSWRRRTNTVFPRIIVVPRIITTFDGNI